MTDQAHRIRSLRWQARAATLEEAFDLRSRCRGEGMELLMPALDEVFDQLAPPGRVLRLPRLELSLKLGPDGSFPPDFAAIIAAQVMAQAEVVALPDVPVPSRVLSSVAQAEPGAETESRDQAAFQDLRIYLATGNLPWEIGGGETRANVVNTLRSATLADLSRVVGWCVAAGSGSVSWHRLLLLLQDDDWPALAEAMAALAGDRQDEVDLFRLLLSDGHRHLDRPLLLRLAASCACAAVAGIAKPALLFDVEELTPPEQVQVAAFVSILPPRLHRAFVEATGFSGLAHEGAGVMHRAEATVDRSQDGMPTLPDRRATHHPVSRPGEELRTAAGHEPAPEEIPEAERREPLPTAEGLFPLLVRDAGLVILAPFLARFLAAVGVAEEAGTVIPTRSLPRAAALLSFLATGEDEPYEFDLGLVKVLLGLHPADSLPVSTGLVSEQDLDEADALLAAVIGHWSALKNTSPAGLRATFLRRDGLLREGDEGWRLVVERTGFDILLEQLPWTLSIVKLPWMAKPLMVEW